MSENTLAQVSDHVYWLSPGKPDRPSLGAVVGADCTLLLDAGASATHARRFLKALASELLPPPRYVALTHWHWDHIFGAAELGVPVIAQTLTADHLARLAGYAWHDAALDERVKTGEEIAACASDIKLELPEPRQVQIILPEIVFAERLDIRLGDVTCQIHHVGGDHSDDSCAMFIEPDRVLFLGDCLGEAIYTSVRHYTTRHLFPLLDTLLRFDADYFIEGHYPAVTTRSEFKNLADRLRLVGQQVNETGPDEPAVLAALAQAGQRIDEEVEDFVRAFCAGCRLR